MTNISIGDKIEIKGKQYIVCRPDELYYLINIKTGACWTNGLQYEQLILESISYNFKKIK